MQTHIRASKPVPVAPAGMAWKPSPVDVTRQGLGARDCGAPMDLAPGSRCAIRSYSMRNPWLDSRDLEQEAAVAALEASRAWRSDGGASRDWYEARAVALALSRFVAEQRAPVSLPKAQRDGWKAATAAQRAPLVVQGPSGQSEAPDVARVAADGFTPPEEMLDLARASVAIRSLLDRQSEAARAVLLGEEKYADVAKRMGRSLRSVSAETLRAQQALRRAFCKE